MATQTVITWTDDLDNLAGNDESPATNFLTFGYEGRIYYIDLNDTNADRYHDALTPFVKAATAAGALPERAADTMPAQKRPRRAPSSTPQHQGDTDPAAVRAWAREQSLLVPARGRVPAKTKAAYTAHTSSGDTTLLDELIKEQGGRLDAPIPYQAEEGDPGWEPGDEPHEQTDSTPADDAGETAPPADSAEAEATKHYRPIKRSARMTDDAKWQRRTGYGCERTDKIADWTFLERIEALSDQNLRILGMLAGEVELGKGGKVGHLKTSDARLENLEMIEADGDSVHGWSITEFGRYAYKVRTSNG
ncbi:Lsr2 family protein [Streptomyces sp. NPDC051840]|uniref:histone-like nucleoid-structuring protein Lsr2 n=1 Tax=Streptomyces sp. NPDC051840 TaxID=3154752 RepID=UPI00341F172C